MAKEIAVLSGGSVARERRGLVGLLYECATDSSLAHAAAETILLPQLIGEFATIKARAFQLARKLLQEEPIFRGVQQLGIFEELVIRELQHAYHLLYMHDELLRRGISDCQFDRSSWTSEGFGPICRALGPTIRVSIAEAAERREGAVARSWRRIVASKFAVAAVRSEMHEVLNRIDPVHRRHAYRAKRSFVRDGIWFYSTAYTCTKIGLLYEPYFPRELNYLIENPLTGGRALEELGRQYVPLYDFASAWMIPSARESAAVGKQIVESLRSVRLDAQDSLARDYLLRSRFFETFMRRLLPIGLFSSALFDDWVAKAQPAALVVGNPVFEGYATLSARRSGIPTILLQHGVLGDYCQFWDPPVDHYIVRGQFWQDFLSPAARKRARVLNPSPATVLSTSLHVDRDSLVFLTAPYPQHEFWQEKDLDEILCVLLRAVEESQKELVIRVHPLESLSEYRGRVDRLARVAKRRARVRLSQGPGLERDLARAAAVLTYWSTVFLDCVRDQIPIISFGWHDFSFKPGIERNGVFHFARDLADLERLATIALRGQLPAFSGRVEPFLAASATDQLARQLAEMAQIRGTKGPLLGQKPRRHSGAKVHR